MNGDDYQDLVKQRAKNVKMKFVCSECHKAVIQNFSIYRIKKYPMLCAVCGTKQKMIDKYGSYENYKKILSDITKKNCQDESFKKFREDCYKQSMLKKFGVQNCFQLEDVKQKCRKNTLKTLKERYGVQNVAQIENVRKKITETQTKNGGVGFARKKLLESIKKQNLELFGSEFPRTKKIFKYNQWFDSFWELKFYEHLKSKNISFEYHPKEKFEYQYDGKTHYYCPDFKLACGFVEIKGPQFFKEGKMINPYDHSQDAKYEAKHQCMLRNSVRIITDINEIELFHF